MPRKNDKCNKKERKKKIYRRNKECDAKKE